MRSVGDVDVNAPLKLTAVNESPQQRESGYRPTVVCAPRPSADLVNFLPISLYVNGNVFSEFSCYFIIFFDLFLFGFSEHCDAQTVVCYLTLNG